VALAWQPSLLGDEPPGFDRDLGGLVRHDLAGGAWYDVVEGWAQGADRLFGLIATSGGCTTASWPSPG
jgi:hypothetical protein